MQFLIDENVRREVADFLKSYGESIFVPSGASDAIVAGIARKENRILITHDKDFANQLMYPPEKFAGIILIKIHPPVVHIITDALAHLFSEETNIHIAKHIVILSAEGFLIHPSDSL
jgi:predicted nuclease of predicted toxin-antitoxin system